MRTTENSYIRAIREVCDNSFDAAHGDARVYRNTLIQLASLLAIVLAVVAIFAWVVQRLPIGILGS